MKKIKSAFIILLQFIFMIVYAQFPSNDGTWELKKEDQFNSYVSADWRNTYPWGNFNNGAEYNDPANLIYSNGWLKIKSDRKNPPVTDPTTGKVYYYQGGVIQSKFTYKYGYFESSIKTPIGKGYWPAYWLWRATHCQWYDEIDIHERGGDISVTSNETSESNHWFLYCDSNDKDITTFVKNVDNTINNCANAHTYSLLWQPNRMTYYIDNSTVHIKQEPVNSPSHDLELIFNFAIDPWTLPNQNTTFPAYFEIDYIKVWQLKTACSTSESICTFTKASYDQKVKKDITFGGTSCNTSMNTSDAVAFWAKDHIILDKNCTINANGSGYICFNTYNCSN